MTLTPTRSDRTDDRPSADRPTAAIPSCTHARPAPQAPGKGKTPASPHRARGKHCLDCFCPDEWQTCQPASCKNKSSIRLEAQSPMDEDLRKTCKKLLVDLDMDSRNHGSMSKLADSLSLRMGRRISRSTLSMALSGFRETAGYQAILKELKEMLSASINAQGNGHYGLT